MLDILDVDLDASGGGNGLLALKEPPGALHFPWKRNKDRSRCSRRDEAHQRDDESHVLGDQASVQDHSMTESARKRISCGNLDSQRFRAIRSSNDLARGLVAKYVTLIVALVSFVLVASSAIGLYSLSKGKCSAPGGSSTREKAIAAATRIEIYIKDIEHQMAWTALPQIGSGAQAVEPAALRVSEAPAPDAGDIRAAVDRQEWKGGSWRVSRLALDVAGAGTDYSDKPAFKTAAAGTSITAPCISARRPSLT